MHLPRAPAAVSPAGAIQYIEMHYGEAPFREIAQHVQEGKGSGEKRWEATQTGTLRHVAHARLAVPGPETRNSGSTRPLRDSHIGVRVF